MIKELIEKISDPKLSTYINAHWEQLDRDFRLIQSQIPDEQRMPRSEISFHQDTKLLGYLTLLTMNLSGDILEIGVWKGLGMELDAVEVSIVRCCKMDLEIHFSPKIGKFSALSGLLKTLKFPLLLKEVSIGAWSLPGRSQGISGSQSTESLFSPRRQPSKKSRSTEWISEEGTCKAKG